MTERTGQNPDPADSDDLRYAVSQQGIFLGRQADALSQIASAQQDLFRRLFGMSQTLSEITSQASIPAPTVPAATSGNNLSSAAVMTPENFRLQPEPFHGDTEACGGFLLQCQLLFQQAPRYYLSDHSKITLIINSLRSKALQWAQAFLSANPISHLPFERFIDEFKLVFDQPRKQDEAARKLLTLRQRNRSVSEHIIDFRILAVEAGWSDPALRGFFYQSLNEAIKDHLCTQPEANTFEELAAAALRSDIRLQERNVSRSHAAKKATTLTPLVTSMDCKPVLRSETPRTIPEEPMRIGHSKITAEERLRRRNEGACFYCGETDHQINRCSRRLDSRTPPLRDRPRGDRSASLKDFLFVPVKLCHQSRILDFQALVDSGAEQSLIDQSIVDRLTLPTEQLPSPVHAAGLGGQHLSVISHRTKPVLLVTSGNHHPADPEGLRLAVTHQGIALGRQAESLNQMAAAQQDLFRRLDGISLALTDLTSRGPTNASASNTGSATGSPGPAADKAAHENIRLLPEPFLGDVGACGGFLLQCRLIFQQAPRHYHADHSKITLIVNSLRGKALQWAQAYLTANPISQVPFERFLGEFRLVFDQPRKEEEATRRLLALKQRHRSRNRCRLDILSSPLRSGRDEEMRGRVSIAARPVTSFINVSFV
ncbi:uncharacterized protein LOC144989588 [Oryzias latipes]